MSLPLGKLLAAGAVGLMLSATPVLAETMNFSAQLAGSTEVPPNEEAGTGTVTATYDTDSKEFAWTIDYSGLTGDATAAHFHGPAAEGENAPPVVPIDGDLASPIEGSATLTDEQAADLTAGKWYFNIHTEKYPDGEIRGQVMAQ
jgi:hypothetical protein